MKIILVIHRQNAKGARVMVNARKPLLQKTIHLLEQNKDREAFDLLANQAEVESYLPPGQNPLVNSLMILDESLL